MAKIIEIPFEEIDSPEKATSGTQAAFARAGKNIHRHEVDRIEDDPKRRKRVIHMRPEKTYFFT